jgi:hypothetical protein
VARSRPGGRKIESQVNSDGGGTVGRLPEVKGGSEDVTSVIPGKG